MVSTHTLMQPVRIHWGILAVWSGCLAFSLSCWAGMLHLAGVV